jgi:dolichol-phosphate mannosyltransferase
VYNERECLDELARRLTATLSSLTGEFEVILVNDGSKDGSWERMQELRQQDPRIKLLNLSRNFGHQIAVTAGLDHARGEAVVLIDADLQDPPELIPELFARYQEGYDVVYAVRIKREQESAFKKFTAYWFYRLFRWATDVEMPVDTGDFRLMSRRVVKALSGMRERHRMLRGLVSWLGYQQVGVSYERAGRFAGTTKYPFRKMLRFALDGIASFSLLPLRLASWLGAVVSLLAFLYGGYAILAHMLGGTVDGWTSIVATVTLIGGVQLLCVGVLGEYIGRIYDEARARPLYFIADYQQ